MKTSQIAEEHLVMTMDKAQETKLLKIHKLAPFLMFSADISKSEEFQRRQPIDKALHCDFSATKKFSKNLVTIFFNQKDSRSFQQWVQQEAKRSILQDY